MDIERWVKNLTAPSVPEENRNFRNSVLDIYIQVDYLLNQLLKVYFIDRLSDEEEKSINFENLISDYYLIQKNQYCYKYKLIDKKTYNKICKLNDVRKNYEHLTKYKIIIKDIPEQKAILNEGIEAIKTLVKKIIYLKPADVYAEALKEELTKLQSNSKN